MHIQNLDKFFKRVLKILSENENIMTDERTNKRNDNLNPIETPLIQTGAIIIYIMLANPMNTDQSKQSDLGTSCLKYIYTWQQKKRILSNIKLIPETLIKFYLE